MILSLPSMFKTDEKSEPSEGSLTFFTVGSVLGLKNSMGCVRQCTRAMLEMKGCKVSYNVFVTRA